MQRVGCHVVDVDVVDFAFFDVAASGCVLGDVELWRTGRVFASHFGDFGAEGAEAEVHDGH